MSLENMVSLQEIVQSDRMVTTKKVLVKHPVRTALLVKNSYPKKHPAHLVIWENMVPTVGYIWICSAAERHKAVRGKMKLLLRYKQFQRVRDRRNQGTTAR